MCIQETLKALQDKSVDTQTIQKSMTDLIEVFLNALQVKPKILKDFSRIVRQGRQNRGEGYLLVDIGPMYLVQLDVNFIPVFNKDAEKGSLDVIWMNQEITEQLFREEGKHFWLNFKKYINSTDSHQFILSVFLKFDRGEYFQEDRIFLDFKHITIDLF